MMERTGAYIRRKARPNKSLHLTLASLGGHGGGLPAMILVCEGVLPAPLGR